MSSDYNPGQLLPTSPEPEKPAAPAADKHVSFTVGTRAGQVTLQFSQPVPGLLFDAQEARELAGMLCKMAGYIDPQRKRHKGKGS